MRSSTAICGIAAAFFAALPAHSQPFAAEQEAELIGLHQRCDHDDRLACIRFGFILGSAHEFQAQWRNAHPDWWAFEPHLASITVAPPELPLYEQPPIPAPGYMWTPGYWAYGPAGYFWVPGTWLLPPAVGLLWTPGYWGWRGGIYAWNAGYWGPHIGFYGGVNYGFGYGGIGYEGGRWNNGVFAYNQTVNNFGGVRVTNVYSQPVVAGTAARVSFNGGSGGTRAQPTPQDQAAAHEQHVAPTAQQAQHQQMASSNRALLASENHGQPAIAATAKPGEFSGKGIVAARETNPGGARPGEPPTGTLGTTNTNPTGLKTTNTTPTGTKAPATNPSAAKTTEISPTDNKLEQKRPGGDRATINGGTSPKPLNTEAKPLTTAPPAGTGKPNGPPPRVATAKVPHPANVPHPPAKPGPPSKDKKPPPG